MPRAVALTLVALLAACRGGGDDGDGKRRRGVATEVTAAELYRDYAALRGTDVLDAYAGGVVVTGTVAEVVELGDEGLEVRFAVDRGALALAFIDLGAEARRLGIRRGVQLRARCQVGGKPQDTLFLTACVLQ
jgi:hypothetical protein